MKSRLARKILALSLSAMIAAPSATAVASYAEICEFLLDGTIDVKSLNAVESKFVERADTPEKALQLLFDYQVIFGPNSSDAMILALAGEGVDADFLKGRKPIHRQSHKPALKILTRLRQLFDDQAALERMAKVYFENLVTLTADSKNDVVMAEVRHLQVARLKAAIEASPKREIYMTILKDYAQQAILKTAAEFRRQLIEHQWGELVWIDGFEKTYNIGVSALTIAMLNGGVLGLSQVSEFVDGLSGALHTLGVIVGAALSFPIRDVLYDHGHPDKILNHIHARKVGPNLDDRLTSFNVTRADGREAQVKAKSILENMEVDFSPRGVLSLHQACQLDVCKMTPVQIAYMGHYDLLELQRQADILKAAMGARDLENDLKELRSIAGLIREQPNRYRLHARLARLFDTLIKTLESLQSVRGRTFESLRKQAEGLKEAVRTVSAMPYQALGTQTDEQIYKSELLLAKVRSDLVTLDTFKLNTEAFERRIESTQALLARVRELRESLPKSESGWKDIAEELLVQLDKIGAMQ